MPNFHCAAHALHFQLNGFEYERCFFRYYCYGPPIAFGHAISVRHRNFSITKSNRILDPHFSMLKLWICRHRRTDFFFREMILFYFPRYFSHLPLRKRKQEKIDHRISLTTIDSNVHSISMFFLMEPTKKWMASKLLNDSRPLEYHQLRFDCSARDQF